MRNFSNKLKCGSRNHLRAFIKQLKKNNGTYSPQYISQDEFNKILKSSKEQCGKGNKKRQAKGKGMGKGKGQRAGHGLGRGNGQGRGRSRNMPW